MQIGSLRQLTLTSLAVVLVPLAVLLWQSQNALGSMSQIAASEAQFSVGMARKIGSIENIAIDIERLIRQYHVLRKEELKTLSANYFQRMDELLESVCLQLSHGDPCRALNTRISWFKANSDVEDELLLDAQLAEFRQSLGILRRQVDNLLDTRIQRQQAYVEAVQNRQAWLTAVLAGVCLVLIAFASRIISRPVEKIEKVIGAIARQETSLPEVSRSGPKELIEVEHKLHRLSERLEQLEHLRHALLRHASHELKTPLASIKEGCSLLTEGVVGPLSNQQQEVVSLLNSSTERLSLLIEQLLDYNLLLQQAKPVYQDVNCQEMFDTFLTENSLAVSQNNHQIALSLKVDSMVVDGKLFRRILDNLLSNAIAHGSVGRPIDINLYTEADKLVLDVANRGRKIPQEMRKVLFEPFKRGENRRNDRVVGSGLGLSIVSDCARLMHGTVGIVDVDYADVCMRVTLPLRGREY